MIVGDCLALIHGNVQPRMYRDKEGLGLLFDQRGLVATLRNIKSRGAKRSRYMGGQGICKQSEGA